MQSAIEQSEHVNLIDNLTGGVLTLMIHTSARYPKIESTVIKKFERQVIAQEIKQ
jgi:hypothetical protein